MEEKKLRIALVVVTYNRRELLIECLNAVDKQTFKPSKIIIVDNASTDGTYDRVSHLSFSLPINYIMLEENIGGSGGFYTGLKAAHESGEYDAYWLMDDDGIPDKNCLKELVKYLYRNGYVAPLVLSRENPKEVAFPYLKERTLSEIKEKYGIEGIIPNYANPFNGILLRKDAVQQSGYPNKNMFIWGDENEYDLRLKGSNHNPITVIKALHIHPKDRMVYQKDIFGRLNIVYVDSPLRNYCIYRNTAYLTKKYSPRWRMLYLYFLYSSYFLFRRGWDLKGLVFFHRAFCDGIRANFTNHKQYLC